MPKAQETQLEIDLRALSHNYHYLRSKLKSSTRFLGVVKAFAYGNDAVEVAKNLVALGADYLAVAYVHEGAALRSAGIRLPILVLHPQKSNFNTLIENCLEPSLYSLRVLEGFISIAQSMGLKDYPVHINFNTGLNRLGFESDDLPVVSSRLKSCSAVKVAAVFSHLAASEDLNERDFSQNQINSFKTLAQKLGEQLGYRPFWHLCNTSGVLNFPEAHFDMVRCGIGLYGFGNSEKEDAHLKPIAALKTVISQIHTIAKGNTVGYNRAFRAAQEETIATLPIGHADGIGRHYGHGKGYVMIHGKKAPIVGNVCMDMIMVQVTGIDCSEGDEVLVFGGSAPVTTLAGAVDTISYEILTAISQRVKRVYLRPI